MEELNGLSLVYFLVPIALILLIFIGNIIVIICILHCKQLHTATYTAILILACFDITLAFCLPFAVMETYRPLYLVSNQMLINMSGASLSAQSLIAFNRFQTLTKPLSYKASVTIKRTLYLTALILFYCTLVAWTPFLIEWNSSGLWSSHSNIPLLQLILKNTYALFFIAVFIPACFVTFFCYYKIYGIAKRHSEMIAALEISLNHSSSLAPKQAKYAKTITCIICAFLLWFPFQMCVVFENATDLKTMKRFRTGLLYLAIFNCILNPWIYSYNNSQFRLALKLLCRNMFGSCLKHNRQIMKKVIKKPVHSSILPSFTVLPVYQNNIQSCCYEYETFLHISQPKRKTCFFCPILNLPHTKILPGLTQKSLFTSQKLFHYPEMTSHNDILVT
ncbi:trace amine-associated receptor 1-like [Argonauta hians]